MFLSEFKIKSKKITYHFISFAMALMCSFIFTYFIGFHVCRGNWMNFLFSLFLSFSLRQIEYRRHPFIGYNNTYFLKLLYLDKDYLLQVWPNNRETYLENFNRENYLMAVNLSKGKGIGLFYFFSYWLSKVYLVVLFSIST